MGYRDFEELGDKIQSMVEDAVHSQNYRQLNYSINQVVNSALNTGTNVVKKTIQQTRMVQNTRKNAELYNKLSGEQAKGIAAAVVGGVFGSGMAIGALVTGILSAVGIGSGLMIGTGLLTVGALGGAAVLIKGCRHISKVSRFKCYVRTLGDYTYCNFPKLAQAVRRDIKFVKKDVLSMIHKGWFLEGHVDQNMTCLITSNETYDQYMQTQKQLEMRQKEEKPEVEITDGISQEVQAVLDKGNEFLLKIRQSNDAIPGEEISAKISRMEKIIKKIFERVKEHPEIISDLKRLMNYYLPMTVKLLDAYEEMDKQPIQGETIINSKKEIEDTLDTLNVAFEKLLDSVFEDTAMDVSSDISVLKSILAQEGLTEDDFSKMRRNV